MAVERRPGGRCSFVLALAALFACTPRLLASPEPPPTRDALVARALAPDCRIVGRYCRVGCSEVEPATLVRRVAPDLGSIEKPLPHGIVIAEVALETSGRISAACLRRSVRADVDAAAIRALFDWEFKPPRWRVDGEGHKKNDLAAAVLTVTVQVPK